MFRQIYPGSNHSIEKCQSKTVKVNNLAANVDIEVLQAAIKKIEAKTAGPAGDGASTSAAADDKKKNVLSHKDADIIQHDSHLTDAQMDTWLMHYRSLSVSKCQISNFQPAPTSIASCAGALTTRLLSHTPAAQHSQHSTASQD